MSSVTDILAEIICTVCKNTFKLIMLQHLFWNVAYDYNLRPFFILPGQTVEYIL